MIFLTSSLFIFVSSILSQRCLGSAIAGLQHPQNDNRTADQCSGTELAYFPRPFGSDQPCPSQGVTRRETLSIAFFMSKM